LLVMISIPPEPILAELTRDVSLEAPIASVEPACKMSGNSLIGS
jgi:hypothetical protein